MALEPKGQRAEAGEIAAAGLDASPGENGALEWRVHLAHGQPGRVARLAAVLATAAGIAVAVFGHPLPVIATLVLLCGAVSDFLLPTTFLVTAEGVARRNGLSFSRLAWRDARRCWRDAQGVKISPLAHSSALEAFRGIYVRFPADDAARSRLLSLLERYAPPMLDAEDPGEGSDAGR